MIDQALIDKATELINSGMMYKDVVEALHVKPCTISGWRTRGLIPPTPFKPTTKQAPVENQKKMTNNHGKVRYAEPLPKLEPGQRLDGSPIIAAPAPVIEEKEEKENMTFEAVAEAPVVEIKKPDGPKIRRKLELVGDYTTVRVIGDEVTVSVRTDTEHLTKREAIALLMDISDELEAMINLPEMSL